MDSIALALAALRAAGQIQIKAPTAYEKTDQVNERGQRLVRLAPKTAPASTPDKAAPAPSAPKTVFTAKEATLEDAKIFNAAIRNVSKFSPGEKDKIKAAEIAAIEGFVGFYAYGQPHGAQLDAARQKAGFMVRSASGELARTPGKSKASPTVAGWVSGVPKPNQREVMNLHARNRVAMELVIDLEKVEDLITFTTALEKNGHEVPKIGTDAEALILRDEILRIENAAISQRNEELAKLGYL